MKVWRIVLALAAIGASVLASSGPMPYETGDAAIVLLGRHEAGGRLDFAIVGRSVTGLYPGASKRIELTVVNPYNYPLRVDRLAGELVATSRHGCRPSSANLRVAPYSGNLPMTIRPYGRQPVRGGIVVTMPRGATATCAGTRFTIALSGSGARASR